jgi:transcription factor S
MDFCPKCGAILVLKKKNFGCPRCTYSTTEKVNMKISEKMDELNKGVAVSKEKGGVNPIVNEKCKKCSSEKAYFWTVQTRASDEAETKFFKCVKCDNTWREYR